MGSKEKQLRVVIDTNVLVSALLFGGTTGRIVSFWKGRLITALFSKETFQEFSLALRYPKFALTEEEIRDIVEEEVLPFFEVVKVKEKIKGICSDPDDDKFLSCGIAGAAEFIVTGDRHLLAVKEFRSVRIISPSKFFSLFPETFG